MKQKTICYKQILMARFLMPTVDHDRSYLDILAEEVNDRLQDQGHVTIAQLTTLYDLPADFLSEVDFFTVVNIMLHYFIYHKA